MIFGEALPPRLVLRPSAISCYTLRPSAAREFLPPARRLFLCDAGCPMRRPPPEIIEMNDQKQQELLRRIEGAGLEEGDFKLIRAVFESYAYLTDLIDDRNTSIGRLRKLLFGARTEKTANVIGRDQPVQTPSTEQASLAAEEPAERKKGHGRNGADSYPGANRVKVPHESLQAGDPCPDCEQGTVYAMSRPGVLIRFVGQPPITAAIYELEKLRCNLCGEIFTAQAPPAESPVPRNTTPRSPAWWLCSSTGPANPSIARTSCRRAWEFRCRPRRNGTSSRPQPRS